MRERGRIRQDMKKVHGTGCKVHGKEIRQDLQDPHDFKKQTS
jgi:hypothetical protein